MKICPKHDVCYQDHDVCWCCELESQNEAMKKEQKLQEHEEEHNIMKGHGPKHFKQ